MSSRRANRKDAGIYRPVSLMSLPRKMMEQLIVEVFSRSRKDKKVIWNSHHGFIKRKSYLTGLIAFDKEMVGLVFEGSTVDVAYL